MNSYSKLSTHLIDQLCMKHQTPFFLYESEQIAINVKSLKNTFGKLIDVFYSFKANPNTSICAFIREQGVNAEVSSHAELLLAQKIGFVPNDIIFVGPGKTEEDLEKAVQMGIYAIVVESKHELEILDAICRKSGSKTRVALRINPNFQIKEAPLKMGGLPSQFGLAEDDVTSLIKTYHNSPISIMGLHIYNGTRVLDAKSIAENCKNIFQLASALYESVNFDLKMLDLGGGFGIPYFLGEQTLDMELLYERIYPELLRFKQKFPDTRLIVESGRYLVGNAGSMCSKVLYVKESHGKKFAVMDGGMNCHMAATGVGSFIRRNFPIRLVRPSESPISAYTITGPLCTPNDVIGQDVSLPELFPGDFIQIDMSGAYGPTASPGLFISHGFPAEIFYYQNRDFIIRKGDTYEDIFRNHINIFQHVT